MFSSARLTGRAFRLLVLAAGLAGAGQLQVHCLNVGQGDGTLIISPTGRRVLIDAGYDSLGIEKVLPWLDSLGIRSLDWVVATHYHADHIGGLDEVIAGLGRDSIRQAVYDRSWSYSTNAYDDYAAAAGGKRRTMAKGLTLDLGGGASLTCLGLNGNGRLSSPFTDPPWSENDLAIAMRVSYGRFDFSISGDLSGESTEYYRDIESAVAPEIGPVEVLRVNHHGSAYSSNPFFLAALDPLASVVSCGENDYGHPDAGTMSRLRDYGPVYQTADRRGRVVDGDIIITTDGESFVIEGDTFECKVGVEERRQPQASSFKPQATIVRGVLTLPFAICNLPSDIVVIDASGRTVFTRPLGHLTTGPFSLDLSDLAPGVYLLVAHSPSGSTSRKFVLAR